MLKFAKKKMQIIFLELMDQAGFLDLPNWSILYWLWYVNKTRLWYENKTHILFNLLHFCIEFPFFVAV